MTRLDIEIGERAVLRRTRIPTESIQRALELCRSKARVVFPVEPLGFYATDAVSVEDRHTGSSQWHAKVAA